MRTLATGIYLVCFIAFSTAHMGAQTEPMLFLLLGWGRSHQKPQAYGQFNARIAGDHRRSQASIPTRIGLSRHPCQMRPQPACPMRGLL